MQHHGDPRQPARALRSVVRTTLVVVALAAILGAFLAFLTSGAGRPAASPSPSPQGLAALDPAQIALHRTAAASGFLGYGLMVGALVWGLLITTGLARRSVRRQTLYGGHMTMAIMTLSFTAIHVLANGVNPHASFTMVGAVLPFLGGESLGIALGVVSLELTLAVAVSVWLQRRLQYRRWQAVHWLAYPAFVLAIFHVFLAGSDVRGQLVASALVATVVPVLVLFVFRAAPTTSLVRTRIAPAQR